MTGKPKFAERFNANDMFRFCEQCGRCSSACPITGVDGFNMLQEKGLVLSGVSPDGNLVEMVELPEHPWFVGCQFHPEFKSRPMAPHPLFREFIRASLEHKHARGG